MKKHLIIMVIAFLVVLGVFKMTSIKSFAKASFVPEEEVVAEETSAEELTSEEVSEITSEVIEDNEEDIIIEETSEEEISEEPASEEEISEEEVIVDLDEETSEEVNKKGLLPVPEEEDNKQPKGYLPTEEEEDGKVKADVAVIEVEHKGDRPNSINETSDGKDAWCAQEEKFHPEKTKYVEDKEAEIDCSKYDNAVVEYSISLTEGIDKTMADEALQSAIWSINGSETDHESILKDNYGQQGVDLYNRYKNADLHPGYSVAYRVLKPVEEHRHGEFQTLITFEVTVEPEEEIIPPTPQPPVPPQPEVDTEITPAVPETGDGNFNPMWLVSIIGVAAVVAGIAQSKKRA